MGLPFPQGPQEDNDPPAEPIPRGHQLAASLPEQFLFVFVEVFQVQWSLKGHHTEIVHQAIDANEVPGRRFFHIEEFGPQKLDAESPRDGVGVFVVILCTIVIAFGAVVVVVVAGTGSRIENTAFE